MSTWFAAVYPLHGGPELLTIAIPAVAPEYGYHARIITYSSATSHSGNHSRANAPSISQSGPIAAGVGAAGANATLRRNHDPMRVACQFIPIPPTVDWVSSAG